MNASPIRESACPSCGGELPSQARSCPSCGAPAGDLPPLETVHGPVVHMRIERRWLGVPARLLLLWLGFGAFGAAVGLFATGSWAWGVVALAFAVVFLGVLAEAVHRHGGIFVERSSQLAAAGRAQAASRAEVWRTRLDTRLARWRTTSQLEQIGLDRAAWLQELGDAVWREDAEAEREARRRLEELDEQRERVEESLSERLAGAEEKIRLARLPVQETMMVSPNEPSAPYPPPDEGDPPQPAQVPEPYPPPDEGTPPTPAPAPDPSRDESQPKS